jgi:hypothetical protein
MSMALTETAGGVSYDPGALDLLERLFWRDIWDAAPTEVAAEHGVARGGTSGRSRPRSPPTFPR